MTIVASLPGVTAVSTPNALIDTLLDAPGPPRMCSRAALFSALAALPASTQVCCAHEYTLSNLKFARAVEPDNADLQRYSALCESKRAAGVPTLPSRMSLELQINPFLRTRQAEVIAAAQRFDPSAHDPVGHLAALRQWKNQF